MAVQRSASQPGQFSAGVAAAQAGRGGHGRGDTFHSAHTQQHQDSLDRMDEHERRIATLEQVNNTTFDASAGKMKDS